MSYIAVCVVATLLLATFIMASVWMHLAREVQARRLKREQAEILESYESLVGRLQDLADVAKDVYDIANVNAAGKLLDESMRRTIAEGIELSHILTARNEELAQLIEARRVQKIEEVSTIVLWSSIRDDLMKFADQYPAYVFQQDEGEKAKS